MKSFFVLACIAVFMVALDSTSAQCIGFNGNCLGAAQSCCDGLECISGHNGDICQLRWRFQSKTKGEKNGESVEEKASPAKIVEAFIESMGDNHPCIGSGGNCVMVPSGCCNGLTCSKGPFGFWSCG